MTASITRYYKKTKETLIKWLRGRITAFRGTRNLAVYGILSWLLRSRRLTLHPTRSFNRRLPNLTVIFLCLLCLVSGASAADSHLTIKTAELVASGEQYLLNAELELNLSDEVEDALNKGVPLNFLVEFQLTRPREYWFDDEIITVTNNIAFSYHALSRQYLINRNKHQQSFATLAEAKAEFVRLREWKMFDKSLLKNNETYLAALRIRLDQSKLPKPIQVDAIGSEQWNMVSQRYRWEPALTP